MAMPLTATFLFGEKELKLYQRWQLTQPSISTERYGRLPTAFEYEEYLFWRDHLRQRYLPGGGNFIESLPEEEEEGPEQEQERQNDVDGVEQERKEDVDEAEQGADTTQDPNQEIKIDDSQVDGTPDRETKLEEEDEEKEDHLYKTASRCQHPLHPAHPANHPPEPGEITFTIARCPLCTMRAHITLLTALTSRWVDLGGPWRHWDFETDPQALRYTTGTRSYHWAKLDLVREAYALEEWAEAENAWEAEHPGGVDAAVQQYGANAALELLRREYRYPTTMVDGEGAVVEGVGTLEVDVQDRSTPKAKSVAFTPDTPETKGRSNLYFYRVCTQLYDPETCQHASPDPEGWLDTSFMKDYMYVVSQCRILLLLHDPPLPYVSYVDLNDGEDKGDNKHVERLQEIVADVLSRMNADDRLRWTQSLAGTSDIFFVHRDDWGEGDEFDTFSMSPTLVGTLAETYARLIGDIDEEEFPRATPEAARELDEEQMAEAQMEGIESAFCDSDSESSSEYTPPLPEVDELPKDPEIVDQELDDENRSKETETASQELRTNAQDVETNKAEERAEARGGDAMTESIGNAGVNNGTTDPPSREVEMVDAFENGDS